MTGEGRTLPYESDHERQVRQRLTGLLTSSPIPETELLDNLPLYLRGKALGRLLAADALYRMIVDIPGVVLELGVHRGRNLATWTALRAIYEPHNPHRRIVGFDTFTGFPEISPRDLPSRAASKGSFAVPDHYLDHLSQILDAHESGEPLRHIRRTLVVQGEVQHTLPAYLADNPQTLVSLAYFDLDLYEPTLTALRAIRPYLTNGSVLAFDELNHAKWPGETSAVRDELGLDAHRLRLLPGHPTPAYLRWSG